LVGHDNPSFPGSPWECRPRGSASRLVKEGRFSLAPPWRRSLRACVPRRSLGTRRDLPRLPRLPGLQDNSGLRDRQPFPVGKTRGGPVAPLTSPVSLPSSFSASPRPRGRNRYNPPSLAVDGYKSHSGGSREPIMTRPVPAPAKEHAAGASARSHTTLAA